MGEGRGATAVVLAAGASSRMGVPKALVRYGGVPALLRIERACLAAGVARVLVVVGEHARPVRDALAQDLHPTTRLVDHPGWARGRTGSLQAALALAPADAPALVWPVDHPLASPATARALLATPGEWVVPVHGGVAGHPIVLDGAALGRVMGADPATPLRDLRGEVVRVEVDDPGVLANLDTPAARAAVERGI